MSKKISDRVFLIEGEPDGICEMCGKKDELRPYGPKDENICYDCAMKDEETMRRKLRERMDGPAEVTRH